MDEKKPSDVVDALERLQRLKDSGLLSDEEVAQQKAEILRSKTQTSTPTDPLLVRPETLKKISARQSGGGHGLLWGILALAVLGVGGYFGAKAFGIDVPGLPAAESIDLADLPPPPPTIDLNVSVTKDGNYTTLEIQSKMDSVTLESLTVDRGTCQVLLGNKFPKPLRFGESAKFALHNPKSILSPCGALEVEVTTDKGDATYSFN